MDNYLEGQSEVQQDLVRLMFAGTPVVPPGPSTRSGCEVRPAQHPIGQWPVLVLIEIGG